MEINDFTRIQQDFLTALSKTSSTMAAAWADAAKELAADAPFKGLKDLAPQWMDPTLLSRLLDSSSAALRFKEMVELTAHDVPTIVKHRDDRAEIRAIVEKWMVPYQKLIREMVGLPGISDTQRLVDQWKMYHTWFKASPWTGLPGLSSQWPSQSMELFFPSGPFGFAADPMQVWIETYDKVLSKLLKPPATGITLEYEDRLKSAIDAQITFLNTLPEFHSQIRATAEAALEKIIDRINETAFDEAMAETQRAIYQIWISESEAAFVELFRSETFGFALANAFREGLNAKKRMDSLVTDLLPWFRVPSHGDVDEVSEALATMKKEIRRMDREIQSLRDRLEKEIRVRESP